MAEATGPSMQLDDMMSTSRGMNKDPMAIAEPYIFSDLVPILEIKSTSTGQLTVSTGGYLIASPLATGTTISTLNIASVVGSPALTTSDPAETGDVTVGSTSTWWMTLTSTALGRTSTTASQSADLSPMPTESQDFQSSLFSSQTPSFSSANLPTTSETVAASQTATKHSPSSSPTSLLLVDHHENLVAPIVGTIVPFMLILGILAAGCCWWIKKRRRDRELDDLERTAVWVTRTDDSASTGLTVESQEDKTITSDYTSVIPAKDHSTKPESLIPPASIVKDAGVDENECEKRVRPRSLYDNPFSTPPPGDEDKVRASQIGLAITTSMRTVDASQTTQSSTSTVVRLTSDTYEDPFRDDISSSVQTTTVSEPVVDHPIQEGPRNWSTSCIGVNAISIGTSLRPSHSCPTDTGDSMRAQYRFCKNNAGDVPNDICYAQVFELGADSNLPRPPGFAHRSTPPAENSQIVKVTSQR